MSDIDVQIRTSKVNYPYGEPLEVHYEVTNVSSEDLYISRDMFTLIKESDSELKLVVGVNPPGIRILYFHFTPPETDRLGAGQTMARDISLDMPFFDTEIDANDEVREFEVKLSGDIDFHLQLGYGRTDFQAQEHDPLYEFVAWQQLATSNKVRIHIDAP